MLRATYVRIYPTSEQADFLNRQFGQVRFVYNSALRIMSHRYKFHGDKLTARNDMGKLLTRAKKSPRYDWLKESDSLALEKALNNLDDAFQRFFKGQGRYPRFKSKRGKQSSAHRRSLKVGEGSIKIPKCSPIKAKVHRTIEGQVRSITVSRTATGKYYASILVDTPEQEAEPLTSFDAAKVVGLDMGLDHLLIDSNGRKTTNPRFLRNAQANLKRKQRKLSRKNKGSAKRAKARMLVAKAHERVANARNDLQHKLSRRIVDDNQAVIVETLKVKNMMKNGNLARSIGDASWHALLTKLEYKAKAQGKRVVKIDQWFPSSKTCHGCHHKMDAMPLKVRDWTCPSCGAHHDRDINAALNIKHQGIIQLKAEGSSVSARGGKRKSGAVSAKAAAREAGSNAQRRLEV